MKEKTNPKRPGGFLGFFVARFQAVFSMFRTTSTIRPLRQGPSRAWLVLPGPTKGRQSGLLFFNLPQILNI